MTTLITLFAATYRERISAIKAPMAKCVHSIKGKPVTAPNSHLERCDRSPVTCIGREASENAMRPLTETETAQVLAHARCGITTTSVPLIVALAFAGASAEESATLLPHCLPKSLAGR